MRKTLILTGASRGIGKALALELAKEGFDLVLNARKEASLRAVAEEVQALGARAVYVAGSAGKAEVAHALAHTVEERLKRLRRKGGVTPRTLRRIFLEEVERELGPEKARLLAKQTLPFEEIFVVEGRKQRPFSKGLLTRSLEDAGFSLREAHELAKAVERRLRLEGVRRIPAKRLEKVVAEEARRLYGPEAGERYRARLLYAGRYAALSPTPAFAHEERAEFQSLQVEAEIGRASCRERVLRLV